MKPRVVMIISYFYPILGGSEQQAFNLAAGLVKEGISVSVLTRKIKGLPLFEKIMNVPVYRNIITLQWQKLFGITYILSVFWFLYRKRHSYDIIHCHIAQGFHSIVAILFKSLFKKKVIIKVAATGPISDFVMMKKVIFGNSFLEKLKNADRIITICSQSEKEALQEGFLPTTVMQIQNGVDVQYFKPLLSDRKKHNRIVFIGRLDYLKGVHNLIQAFNGLIEEGMNAYLEIVGDGPDREKLENLARDLDINDYICFRGEIKGVVSLLQESTMFVLPSLSEGLSNVILEAMACGLPVVSTRVGGTTDIIQDGINGMLVEPDNVSQLSNAMKQLLKNKKLTEQLGNEARKTIKIKFSMELVVTKYLKLYDQLLS